MKYRTVIELDFEAEQPLTPDQLAQLALTVGGSAVDDCKDLTDIMVDDVAVWATEIVNVSQFQAVGE